MKSIKITSENQGQRLDKFLNDLFADVSRTQIQKSIKQESILVNNAPATVHQFLKDGDSIIIKTLKQIKTVSPETSTTKEPIVHGEIKIIADEPDFFIIEKPAGMLVHPTEKNESNTLIDWLIGKYPFLQKIGENPHRPALVHRLDKDVSGLMIVPKNQDSFEYFKRQFKLHYITKKYTSLVSGEVIRDEDEINLPIGRSKNKSGLFAARPENQSEKSKKARTIFSVLKRFINYTLVEVDIYTGRTHQIRVHMLAYGYPIVGDPLYGAKNEKLKLERIFLHATSLSFTGPDGKPYHYTSQLPPVLEGTLAKLKTK